MVLFYNFTPHSAKIQPHLFRYNSAELFCSFFIVFEKFQENSVSILPRSLCNSLDRNFHHYLHS